MTAKSPESVPESGPEPVYGHRLPAPRPTLWLAFLLACLLSLPVALVTLAAALLP